MIETDVMEELDSIEDMVPNKDWTNKDWKENGANNNSTNDNVKKISVQEKNGMDDVSKVSRVVVDKNGNKVVRKRLFSVSIGTLLLITVAATAIVAVAGMVKNNSNDYTYVSSEYSYFE